MGRESKLRKIVVTGPESAGKTVLCQELAGILDADWIPEYARSYVENLDRPYDYQDLEAIARHQVWQETETARQTSKKYLVLDTWLIITKVWFEVVYGHAPQWLADRIAVSSVDLFLVCAPDLPWIPDPVRENGGEMRNILFQRYCDDIDRFGFRFEVVKGTGPDRLRIALKMLEKHGLR